MVIVLDAVGSPTAKLHNPPGWKGREKRSTGRTVENKTEEEEQEEEKRSK